MESVRDNLCLIIDVDGFVVGGDFQVREIGYRSWCGDNNGFFFDVTLPYKKLTDKEKRTVHYVSKHIVGLPYRPRDCERPVHHQGALRGIIKSLYREFRTEQRNKIGYKGGNLEKKILLDLNIPSFNIELWGCPKYKQLPLPEHPGCGCHDNPDVNHCPRRECEAFWTWTRVFLRHLR